MRPYQPIEGYEILARLGGGGMGTVFQARQIAMDRVVAIKVLKSNLAKDQKYVERLHREARLLGVLDHPNIVKAYDVGASNGYHYFVMEYVEGRSAASLLQEGGPLPEDQVFDIAIHMARALDHAHRHDIIHRDIKPGNILLTTAGLAKLTDLGLAKREIDPALTRDEATVGTPQYISPEQLLDPKSVDGRSDIFSLGASLYHLASGEPPFQGKTLGQVVAAVLAGNVVDIAKRRPDLDPGLASVLRRMLQRDVTERYANAAELLADLEAVQAGGTPAPWVPPREKRSKRLQAAAIIMVAVAAIVTGWLLWQEDSKPPDEVDASLAFWSELDARIERAPNPIEALRLVESELQSVSEPAIGEGLLQRRQRLAADLRGEFEAIAEELSQSVAQVRLTRPPSSTGSLDRLNTETYARMFDPAGSAAIRILERRLRATDGPPRSGLAAELWKESLGAAHRQFEPKRRDAIGSFQAGFLKLLRDTEESFATRLPDVGSLELLLEQLQERVRELESESVGETLIRLTEVPDPVNAELEQQLAQLEERSTRTIERASRARLQKILDELQQRFDSAWAGLVELSIQDEFERAGEPLSGWIGRTTSGELAGLLRDDRQTFERRSGDRLAQLREDFDRQRRERSDEKFAIEAREPLTQLLSSRRTAEARHRVDSLRQLLPQAQREPEFWSRLIGAQEAFVTSAFEELRRRVRDNTTVNVQDRKGVGRRYIVTRVETAAPDWHLTGTNQQLPTRPIQTLAFEDVHRDQLLIWAAGFRERDPSPATELDLGRAAFLYFEGQPEPAQRALEPLLAAADSEPLLGDAQRLWALIREKIEAATLSEEQLRAAVDLKLAEIEALSDQGDAASLEKALDLIKELFAERYQSLGLDTINRDGLLRNRQLLNGNLERARAEEQIRDPFHGAVKFIDASAGVIQVVYNFEQVDQLEDWDRNPEIWTLNASQLESRRPDRGNLFTRGYGIRHPARENRSLKAFDVLTNSEPFTISFDYRAPKDIDPEFLTISIYGINVGLWSRQRRVGSWLGDPASNLPSSRLFLSDEVPTSDLMSGWGVTYEIALEVIPSGSQLKLALSLDKHPIWHREIPRAEFRSLPPFAQLEIRAFHPAILDNITLTGRLARR